MREAKGYALDFWPTEAENEDDKNFGCDAINWVISHKYFL